MNVQQLHPEQLEELKINYLSELNGDLSYGEIADINELVSDEEVFEAYNGYEFVPDDFACSWRLPNGGQMNGISGNYGLQARFDSRQSFYGKANVIDTKTYLKLQSYDTIVAQYNKKTGMFTILPNSQYAPNGKYSQTTNRHIREFARQLGLTLESTQVGDYHI